MSFTAQDVRVLREKTGAGMLDCKKALTESNGDMEAALDELRKRGLAIAAKKAGRTAAEGLIGTASSGNIETLVEVNCETDFVAKNDDFQGFVANLAKLITEKRPGDLPALLTLPMGGKNIADIQSEMVARIGENIGVRRFEIFEATGSQKMSKYMHAGNKIGVLLLIDDPNNKLTKEAGRDIAMHVAAMSPHYVRSSEVPQDVIAREKEIMRAQMADQKKPAEMIEKIITGKLNKFFNEVCLEGQVFVKDPEGKRSIAKVLSEIDSSIKIVKMIRLQVGEGVK